MHSSENLKQSRVHCHEGCTLRMHSVSSQTGMHCSPEPDIQQGALRNESQKSRVHSEAGCTLGCTQDTQKYFPHKLEHDALWVALRTKLERGQGSKTTGCTFKHEIQNDALFDLEGYSNGVHSEPITLRCDETHCKTSSWFVRTAGQHGDCSHTDNPHHGYIQGSSNGISTWCGN